MFASLSPQRRRLVLAVLAGIVALVVAGAGFAVARIAGGDDAGEQGEPGPVIVVPGYGGVVSSLDPIVAELKREGREVVPFHPTNGGRGDLRKQAGRLGGLASRVLERTGADSVDVIGYSAGGVIARLWVRDGGGDSVARRVLTLGSPHHGTSIAALAVELGGCPRACEELAPGSDLLRALNAGDETPDGAEWITIRSSADHIVTPTASAKLEGALNLLVQRFCPDRATPHTGLPSDPVVLATLPAVLGTGDPHAPRDVSC